LVFVVTSCEVALDKYKEKVLSVKCKLQVQNARNAKRAEGSVLEYGLAHHIAGMTSALEKGLPGDFAAQEEWVKNLSKQNALLVEWSEEFRSKYGEYSEAAETIQECSATTLRAAEAIKKVALPLSIQVHHFSKPQFWVFSSLLVVGF
jgi:hypothetical protein